MIEFTQTMMTTLAVAIEHHRLTNSTIVMMFHPGTEQVGSLVLGKKRCKWYKGSFPGVRDITINMTADEDVLKSMTATLFDD